MPQRDHEAPGTSLSKLINGKSEDNCPASIDKSQLEDNVKTKNQRHMKLKNEHIMHHQKKTGSCFSMTPYLMNSVCFDLLLKCIMQCTCILKELSKLRVNLLSAL